MPTVSIDGVEYVPKSNVDYSGNSKTLGDALTECRNNIGLTLDKAATLAGISKSHLWAIENGETEPSLWIAARIADVYGIDLKAIAELPREIIDY
ncbi:MAG: helix-turn-helix domain-containing protein [Candidatus Thiodiazotropha lotti]|nr:helix-turn-helix domain-containing protein [Candidatus Thiodiazotropha lotti]